MTSVSIYLLLFFAAGQMCVIKLMMSREKEEQIHTLFSKLSDRRVDMSESAILCTAGKVLLKVPHARLE